MEFDVGEIAKTLGGLMAFAVVLYVGVLFYRKEGSFSEEYTQLLEQYKDRNEQLTEELRLERRHCSLKMAELDSKIEKLEQEIELLRSLVHQRPTL